MKRPAKINPILGELCDIDLRVVKEPSWETPKEGKDTSANYEAWEVACRCGGTFGVAKHHRRKAHIGFWSNDLFCFSGIGMRLRSRLLSIPGVKAAQTGDEEFTVVFQRERLAAVAAIVKPYNRRKLASLEKYGVSTDQGSTDGLDGDSAEG